MLGRGNRLEVAVESSVVPFFIQEVSEVAELVIGVHLLLGRALA